MMDNGLSAGDIMALTKDNDGWTNNPFIYLVWLALLGNGNFFGRNGLTTDDGALTRAAIYEGNNDQDTSRNLAEIVNLIGQNRNDTNMQFASVLSAINENRFAQQQCCCDTKGLIKDIAAENYKNTCEITTAIHAEGEATRALINQNTMQDLRDRLAEKDKDNLQLQFQTSQQAQNMLLINTLRPFPIPSYQTCSPYTDGAGTRTNCCTAF